ncbi:MAG: IS21-like element helper ATPase IstB [Eubacteriales bacterium]|nr:IS21-like element helper ATPase IstB [Eubacteriales bacterium]
MTRARIGQLSSSLEAFGMKHAAKALPDLLDAAERNGLTGRELVASVVAAETEGRFERKRKRNYAAAHFPPNVRDLSEFDPSELEGGITASQIAQLAELGWLDAHGNVLLAGPPGLGKTMIALGLGLRAVDEGYTVAYEKMESLVRLLDTAGTDRKAGFRMRHLRKCNLVIVDEIGYTPIEKAQANRFFSFVSDAYERTSMVFTTNKEAVEWEELVGDRTLATAMLDRILHHARCYSLRGESYRLKHPELYAAERQ